MLTERYPSSKLQEILIPADQLRFFPPAGDRAAWQALPERYRAAWLERGRQALDSEWPALPATLFMDYFRTGNRDRYERNNYKRRAMLRDMILAECIEGGGRFLDGIIDGLWLICEETGWMLPAHLFLQDRRRSTDPGPRAESKGDCLPDAANPTVDLFAAETAALLAWTVHLLGKELDAACPLVAKRVRNEIQRRMLTPCMEHTYDWMGLRGEAKVNNWNPWICSNWLPCALLLEPDPARRVASVARAMRCLDEFMRRYSPDGGCDEGPSYWGRAGASLFDCLELLHVASGGAINLFGESLISNMGRFIYHAHICEGWFINFADAGANLLPAAPLVFRYGCRIGDQAMQGFGAYLAQLAGDARPNAFDGPYRQLAAMFRTDATLRSSPLRSTSRMQSTKPAPPLPGRVWMEGIQVMAARPREGDCGGLFVAAKGGHNGESHNHNDIGQFIVYADGKPVLIDVGVETYTAKTFSPERYDIWTMQSQWHNLPTINGCMQAAGQQFAASGVRCRTDGGRARLEMDIAPAYPPAAGVISWVRSVELLPEGDVEITDSFQLKPPVKELWMTLMTPCAVAIDPVGVITLSPRPLGPGLGGKQNLVSGQATVLFDGGKLQARAEEVSLSDSHLQTVWGDKIFRIVLTAGCTPQDTLRLRVRQ